MMRSLRKTLFATSITLALGGLTALGQDTSALDFNAWLEQQPAGQVTPAIDAAAEARRVVRDRIAAVRALHRTTVPLSRAGQWQSQRTGRGAQSWQVQAFQNTEDETLSGRITIGGSGLFSEAKITGKIDGAIVSGVVTGDDDSQLATFTGTVSATGMSGTYETADGDTGIWSHQQ